MEAAAWIFLFQKSIAPETLQLMIKECISNLRESGLHPKFVICDQDITKRETYSRLGVSATCPYFNYGSEITHCFYDTPHLVKSLRKIIMKYNINHDASILKWQYIVDFYNADRQMSIRLAPKLSAKHIVIILTK